MEQFEKLKVAMRYWMLGAASQGNKDWYLALDAMEMGEKFHTGKRKDGITPEYMHQIEIAHHARAIVPLVQEPIVLLGSIFLHDVPEDYDVGFEEIETKFNKRFATVVRLMTKKHRGLVKDTTVYYDELAEDITASLGKGEDRLHNISSMVGVFSIQKQIEYVEETNKYVLPMLKKARRNFPQQEQAYEIIKDSLVGQIEIIQHMLEACKA